MKCPECGYEQYCPCEHCRDLCPPKHKKWIWIDGELIKCANCGITKHADWWLDKSMEILKERQSHD